MIQVEEQIIQVEHLLMSSNWIMENFLLSHTPKATVAIPPEDVGGKVYHVTSLEDDASGSISGSLRWAMKQDGPKTIVFDVSGTIYLKSELKTQKDDLTIAGQTSPGGICIANYPFTINSSNIIIRFIRFRPGNSNVDCDGLGGCDKQNVIIDHCSVSWGSDECLSVYGMQILPYNGV